VRPYVVGGAGFLLAVLWFDLMFDVQMVRRRSAEASADAVASMATYYRRVTTDARPMNRLVAAVMLATLAAVVIGLARSEEPRWAWWVSLVLVIAAVGLAAGHTVPAAIRLGARGDSAAQQHMRARSILRDHVCCFAAIAAVLVLQLAVAS
jgi:ER membrane protein SH3